MDAGGRLRYPRVREGGCVVARRRKPEEPVQEAPAESLEEELRPEPEPEPKPESVRVRPKDAVLGYMRELYGNH